MTGRHRPFGARRAPENHTLPGMIDASVNIEWRPNSDGTPLEALACASDLRVAQAEYRTDATLPNLALLPQRLAETMSQNVRTHARQGVTQTAGSVTVQAASLMSTSMRTRLNRPGFCIRSFQPLEG